MPLSQPRLTGNLLIQRVRRHANLTTLFRQPMTAPALGIAQPSPLHLGIALRAPLTTDAAPALPVVGSDEQSWGITPTTNTSLPFMTQPVPLPAAQAQTVMPSATATAAVTAAPGSATPVTPVRTPLSAPLSMGMQPTAQVNRPLPTTAVTATAAVQASVVNPGVAIANPAAATPAQPPQPGRVQTQSLGAGTVGAPVPAITSAVSGDGPMQAPNAATPAQSEEDRTWARLQAIYRGHKERETRGRAGATAAALPLQRQPAANAATTAQQSTSAPVAPSASTPIAAASQIAGTGTPPAPSIHGENAPPLLAVPPANQPIRQPTEQQSVQRVVAVPGVAAGVLAADDTPQVDAMPTVATDDPVSQESAFPMPTAAPELPLEAVWPVQRTSADADQSEVAQPSPALVNDATALMSSGHVAVVREQVRQRLEEVKTGQPTISKVDVLAPRRPRPIQRMSVAASAPVTPTTGTPPDPAEPATAVQHTEALSTVSGTGESLAPSMVPTEVGPLPADLWRLIGATPPVTAEAIPSPTTSPIVSTAVDNTLADGQVIASASLSGQQAAPVVQAARQAAVTPSEAMTPMSMAPPERLQRQMTSEMAPAVVERVDGPSASTATATSAAAMLSSDPVTATVYPETPTTNGESGTQQGDQTAPKSTARKNRRTSNAAPITGGAFTKGQTDTDTVARVVEPPSRASANRLVQRQVMDDGAADTAPEQPASDEQPEKPAPSSTAAPPDTDELARQVYSQLKRKLAVERERLR